MKHDLDQYARHLEESGRYRVLRMIEPEPIGESDPAYPLSASILDVETTGLNLKRDKIIELALIRFSFNASGEIGPILARYAGLQDPGMPIPPVCTEITGITDDMVKGQTLDINRIDHHLSSSDLVIAHHAAFDRPRVENLIPSAANQRWACSMLEVDWKSRSCEGTKLGYILQSHGLFHKKHRAPDDCEALLAVLKARSDKETAFSELYRSSKRTIHRLFAVQAPFHTKDALAARGYTWSNGTVEPHKAWWKDFPPEDFETEVNFLRNTIFNSSWQPATTIKNAFNRYRAN